MQFQRPSKRSAPFRGRAKLSPLYSSLRKLARAMRRGKLDPERERAIKQAEDLGRKRVQQG